MDSNDPATDQNKASEEKGKGDSTKTSDSKYTEARTTSFVTRSAKKGSMKENLNTRSEKLDENAADENKVSEKEDEETTEDFEPSDGDVNAEQNKKMADTEEETSRGNEEMQDPSEALKQNEDEEGKQTIDTSMAIPDATTTQCSAAEKTSNPPADSAFDKLDADLISSTSKFPDMESDRTTCSSVCETEDPIRSPPSNSPGKFSDERMDCGSAEKTDTSNCLQNTSFQSSDGSEQISNTGDASDEVENTENEQKNMDGVDEDRETPDQTRMVLNKTKETEDEVQERMASTCISGSSETEYDNDENHTSPRAAQTNAEDDQVNTDTEALPSQLQQSPGTIKDKTEQTSFTKNQAQEDSQDNSTDSTMETGDAERTCSKLIYVMDGERICKILEADSTEVTTPVVHIPVVAGGDAGTDPVQLSAGSPQVPEASEGSTIVPQTIKSEPVETTEKQTSAKGSLTFDMDPALIPIKPIPALNVVPPQPNKNDTVNTMKAIPYIPPDISLMYQPEEGVMKSKPVPKPTRGRRPRRRTYPEQPTTRRMRFSSPVTHHSDLRTLQGSRRLSQHSYQRYNLPETAVAMPAQYYSTAANPEADFDAIHPDAAGDMVGYNNVGNLPSISPTYSSGRWYCNDEYFKMPHQWYGRRGRGGSGAGRAGRPRGRRGGGGVRQYLQHRLLWARYTGRSQEALDRVLTIINSKCGLKEDAAKEPMSEPYSEVDPMPEIQEVPVYHDPRLGTIDSPCHEPTDPYLYSNQAFSSNINNMMTGGQNSGSLLGAIGSNAVVDGNGYIVYLNHEDSTDFQNPTIRPVLAETGLGLRGDITATATITGKADYHNASVIRDDMELPAQTCGNIETACQFPNVSETETANVTKVQDEGCTPTENGRYPEQEGSNQITGHKRATPKRIKTPVSPVKGQRGRKRQGLGSGGKQKKKVRRSLTFSSPIKQEETLKATENIAKVLTNASENDPSTNRANLPSATTPLPTISNLLQSAANTGISINIHVTNDVTGDRAVRASGDDVVVDRVHNSLDQMTSEGTARGETGKRPVEVSGFVTPIPLHYAAPRHTVEWHGDYQGNVDRSHRLQQHSQSALQAYTGSNLRYPYRDRSNNLGYFTQERPPSTSLDRYYTSDWPCSYTKYLPEHYIANYESQHTPISQAYPSANPIPEWGRGAEIYTDPYEDNSVSRIQAVDTQDVTFPYQRTTLYQPQSNFPEEAYFEPRPHYGRVGTTAFASKYSKLNLAPMPDSISGSRQHSNREDPTYELYTGTQEPQMLEGDLAAMGAQDITAMGSQADLSLQLDSQTEAHEAGLQDQGQLQSAGELTQLPAEHVQL